VALVKVAEARGQLIHLLGVNARIGVGGEAVLEDGGDGWASRGPWAVEALQCPQPPPSVTGIAVTGGQF